MTFFEENKQFSKLIKHYAYKAREPNMETELWTFLWTLKQGKTRPPNDRYIAVCLRNEFIRLSKFYDSLRNYEHFHPPDVDRLRNIEILIDIKMAVECLTEKEKKCLLLNLLYGYTVYEIGEMLKITPQAVSRNKSRALEKIRGKLN